jgi:membrane protease YdiL (CAAX protease family)
VLLGLALIWLFRKFIDKRPFRALGFQMTNGWWKEFGAGFALEVGMWLVIFALTLATGAATIVDVAWNARDAVGIIAMLAFGLAFNVLVGMIEEVDARGYVLQNLAEGIRLVPAIIVSSAYFAILHRLNPGAGWGSTIGIFFAGITLAVGYALTRRLWFSIGMHAAWNFAEGPVFGFLVSGYNMGGLFKLNVTGPEWLMGGAFGPEAGALAVGVEIAVVAGLVKVSRLQSFKVETLKP